MGPHSKSCTYEIQKRIRKRLGMEFVATPTLGEPAVLKKEEKVTPIISDTKTHDSTITQEKQENETESQEALQLS